MAYSGTVDLISGLRPKNNGTFPLVDAKDVYVDDETRLDGALNAKDEQLTQLKDTVKDINERDGIIVDFNDNWERTTGAGYVKIQKVNNSFTLSGTASGSNRYTLLSGDSDISAKSTISAFEQESFTIRLKPNTKYTFTVNLVSGDPIITTSAGTLGFFLSTKTAETPQAFIDLKTFTTSSLQEIEFTTASDDLNYALFVREVSSVTYSGTYKITVTELKEEIYVRFDESQSLTEDQKTVAKTNIGVPGIDATLATTGMGADAKVTGDKLSHINDQINDANLYNGIITDFGDDWQFNASKGMIGIDKTANSFTLSGTASGSYRYTLLSGDERKTSTDYTDFTAEDYTIALKPGTTYSLNISLKAGIPISPDKQAFIMLKSSTSTDAELKVDLRDFNETTEISSQIYATTSNYALFIREVSAVTYSGVYTISIEEVPNLLVDEVKAELDSQELLETKDLKSLITYWEIGTINKSSGLNQGTATRIRTADFIDVSQFGSVKFSIEDGYKYAVCFYDSDKQVKNKIEKHGDWQTDTWTLSISDAFKYIRLLVSDVNNGTASLEYADNLTFEGTTKLVGAVLSTIDKVTTNKTLLGEDNAFAATRGYTGAGNTTIQFPLFVHVTDIHGDATRFNRAMQFAKRVGAKGVFATGDFVDYLTSADVFQYFIDGIAGLGIPVYPCNGNHEQISNTTQEQYNIIFAPLQEQGGYTLASVENPTYWHKDLDDIKLRLISVNQFEDSSSQWIYDMSQEQVDWLCQTISSTPTDYGIIVLEHASETRIVRTDEVKKFCQLESQNPYLLGTIVSDIVDAYISGTTLNKTYSPQSTAAVHSAVTVNYDFSTKNTGTEFIAFVSGHYHKDLVHYESDRTNTMLNLNACCTSSEKSTNLDLARVDNSDTQDAFNVYVFDRERKVVKIVRIGSHLSYDFATDRNYLELSYVSH